MRDTLRARNTKTETVCRESLLFLCVFRLGTKEFGRGGFISISPRCQDELLNLDRPRHWQRIRSRKLWQEDVAGTSFGLAALQGADPNRDAVRPSLRGKTMCQCGSLASMYGERKQPSREFQIYGRSQCSKDMLSEMSGSVLNMGKWPSLLQAMPSHANDGLPARTSSKGASIEARTGEI
jgi:hypothetical protein